MQAGRLSRERHVIVCSKCGFQNTSSDSFCGSCGSFLEWTGSKVEEPAAEVAAPEPEPQPLEPEHQSFIGRVREVVGFGGATAPGGEVGVDAAGAAGSTGATGAPFLTGHAADGGTPLPPSEDAGAAAHGSAPVVISGARVYRVAQPEPEPEPATVPALTLAPTPEPTPEPEPAVADAS